MANQNVPLHEMCAQDRIEEMKPVLEKHGVPEQNHAMATYMMGVAEKHCEDNGIDLNEENIHGNVEVLARMMKPMITRGFAQSSATEICGVWPMKTDQGKIAYMRNYYTNDEATPATAAEGKILILADASAFAVGDSIVGNSAGVDPVGTVLYKEDNTVFVKVTTAGTGFVASMEVDDAAVFSAAETTISAVYNSEIGVSVFREYTKFATIAAAEAATTTIKEVELGVDLANVEAEDHELRIRYTKQFNAKMRDNYGLDADTLTDSIGVMALRQELNRRVFYEVLSASDLGGIFTWDYDDADGRWEEEKIKTLLTYLNFRSADILSANFMEAGTFLVIDPVTYAFFKSYGMLDTSGVAGGMAQPMKNPFVGVLNGAFRVYVNPWLRTRTISMGMKDFSNDPEANTRAGIFFHPYLGIDVTKTIRDANGQPVKFLWTMYGFTQHPLAATVGTNDFFRRVNVDNLPSYT